MSLSVVVITIIIIIFFIQTFKYASLTSRASYVPLSIHRRSVAAEARPAALAASLSLSVSLLCGLSEAAIYSSVTTAYNSAAAGTTTSKAATAAASTGPLQGYARYVLASSVVPSSFTSRTAVASQSFLLSNLNPNLSASHTLKQLVSESGSVRYQLEVLGKLRSAAMVAAAGFVLVNSCLAYREGVGAYGGTVARGTAEIDWSRRLLIGRDGSPLLTLRMGDSVYLTDLLYQAPRAGLGRTVPVLRSSGSGTAAADFESAVAAASGGLGTACFLTQKAAAEQISRLCTRDESAAPKNVLIQAVGRDVHDLNQAKKLASVIDASGGNAVVVYIENDGDTAHASRAGKYRSSRASRAHSSNTATVLSISVHEAALTPLRQWLQLQERKLSTAAPSPALGSEVATKTSPASAILTPAAAAAIASPIAAAETTTAAEPLTEPALLAASSGAPLLQLVAALDAIGGTVRSACEAALALALSGVTTSAAGINRDPHRDFLPSPSPNPSLTNNSSSC